MKQKTVKKFIRKKAQASIVSTTALKKGPKFPSISRTITETTIFSFVQRLNTVALVACISGLLFLGTAIMLISIYQNSKQLAGLVAQKQQTVKELAYWKDMFAKHKGYRDAAFQVAVLAYQLGDLIEAKQYLRQTLRIDPYFAKGRELAAVLGGE